MRISDWSSDVCSSDLKQRKVARAVTARKLLMLICSRPTKKDQEQLAALAPHPALRATFSRKREKGWQSAFRGREKAVAAGRHAPPGSRKRLTAGAPPTRRASLWESGVQDGEISGVAGSFKKK